MQDASVNNKAVFKIISNASTSFQLNNLKILIDPWCVGDLYCGSWSCYPTPKDPESFLKGATHLFISHIHEDHCDPMTLKLIDKNIEVIIPDIYPNHILQKQIQNQGFKNIRMLKVGEKYRVAKDVNLEIIPPINAFGLETRENLLEVDKIAIDTGLMIDHSLENRSRNYAILTDNSPYNPEKFLDLFPDRKVSVLFYPYNGFADDYPLCYDNLSKEEKKKLSLERSLKRERLLLDFIKTVNPEALVPHSSDFALNGPREREFFEIHPQEFLHKDIYAENIQKLTNINAFALYEDDTLEIDEKGISFIRKSTDSDRRYFKKANKALTNLGILPLGKIEKILASNSLIQLITLSAENMFQKCEKQLQKITPWKLRLEIDNQMFFEVDFDKRSISQSDQNAPKNDHVLTLKISSELFISHLSRDLHWNNSQIGCYLTWERSPNEYNHYLYDAINFFHLPMNKSIESFT